MSSTRHTARALIGNDMLQLRTLQFWFHSCAFAFYASEPLKCLYFKCKVLKWYQTIAKSYGHNRSQQACGSTCPHACHRLTGILLWQHYCTSTAVLHFIPCTRTSASPTLIPRPERISYSSSSKDFPIVFSGASKACFTAKSFQRLPRFLLI